jgi:hypothetical protein
MFIDSDMELQRCVVEECVQLCGQGYKEVTVPEISFGTGYWSRCIALEKEIYLDDSLIEAPCFFSKDCFYAVGGYDERLEAGEDWDIAIRLARLGHMAGRSRSSIRHNEQQQTLKKLFFKKYYYGLTIGHYVHKNPMVAKLQLSPLRFLKRKAILEIAMHPVFGVGLGLIKAVQLVALWLGRTQRKWI